jgi:hypothetical protein
VVLGPLELSFDNIIIGDQLSLFWLLIFPLKWLFL